MKYLSDRSLYWLAWVFGALAVYFLASAFYISSQGGAKKAVTVKENNTQRIKVKKQKVLQGEEFRKKPTGC